MVEHYKISIRTGVRKMSDNLRRQINDIIQADIQIGINDYIAKEGGGEKGQKLNASISKKEVDKIIKEYKRLKKKDKSNLSQVKKLGLVDKNGKPL